MQERKFETVEIMIDVLDHRFKEILGDPDELGKSMAFIIQSLLKTGWIPKDSKIEFKRHELRETGAGNKVHAFYLECLKEN